ncbi:MAG: hypothetical protein ABIR79_09600 [Candidatus Binatia bacterium]
MDAETGFVLHQIVMLIAMRSMLALFGRYAWHLTVLLAQALEAGTEIMRDHYAGMLMANRQPAPIPSRSTPKLRRWRRRKR